MEPTDKTILAHFEFCPSCATPQSPDDRSSPFSCAKCGRVIHFSPATSVAALIGDGEGNLLFLKRKLEPRKAKLGVPGGFLDSGEILEEALFREVKEEVGLELESWKYLGGWPNEYPYKSVVYSVTDIYFAARVENFNAVDLCQTEVDAIHIADPRTIDRAELAFSSLEYAIDKYLSCQY